MRILVVEDEEKLANILSRGLKAEGFAVDIAKDGEQGLQLAIEHIGAMMSLSLISCCPASVVRKRCMPSGRETITCPLSCLRPGIRLAIK